MRTVCRALCIAGVLALIVPARAAAEWQFAPFLGYTFGGTTTIIDSEQAVDRKHWHFGGAVTLLGSSPIGVEGYFVRTPGLFQNDEFQCDIPTCVTSGAGTYAFMGNAVLTIPRAWNPYGLRPFLSGGIGLLHASRTDAQNLTPVDLNLLGMNLGGGAVGFLSDRVGLRFDLRYFRNIQGVNPEDLEVPVTLPVGSPVRLRYWTISAGVVFKY